METNLCMKVIASVGKSSGESGAGACAEEVVKSWQMG